MTDFSKGYEFFQKSASSAYAASESDAYVKSVSDEIDNLARDINAFSGFKSDISTLKGDIAEFWHSGTHNIDPAVKGASAKTAVDRSHDFASADITSNFGDLFGLKYYKIGSDSAKEQAKSFFERWKKYQLDAKNDISFEQYLELKGIDPNSVLAMDPIYAGQLRIIPKDQMQDAVKWLERKIQEESLKRPDQVKRYQETLDLLRDRIKSSDGTESIPLSGEDARKLAEMAKQGNFKSEKHGLSMEELIKYKYIMRQAFKAGTTAATISMVLRVAPEIYRAIEYLKKIVEYSMSKNMDTTLVIKALDIAYKLQKSAEGLILHSDLGSQYTSYEFGEYVKAHKLIHSFRGKGNPYDNACIESFYSVLKKEKVNLVKYYDFDNARLAIFEYIV